MTNAFSSMEYPHWLIVAGAVLLLLGFIGLALRRRKGAEATANGNEQGRSEFDAVFAQTRQEKLAGQTKKRWAKPGGTDEPLLHEPKVSDPK